MKLPNGYGSVYRLSGNRRKPWVACVTTGWSEDGRQQRYIIGYFGTRVENGEIAVVLIDDEVTLKRFYKTEKGVILKPENSKYEPLFYTEEDLKNIRILGKAVAFQSRL